MSGLLVKAKSFRAGQARPPRSSLPRTSVPRASVPGGLLARAKALRERLAGRKVQPTSADFLRDKEKDIMAELDAILEKNRLIITETTLNFTARSSGGRLPLAINLAAGGLLLVLGLSFFWIFNRSETSLVSEERRLATAEGRIIEEVRRASREEISRKEAEINSIQRMLADAENAKASLAAGLETELSQREAQLKEALAAELDAERQRLLREGLGEAALNARLADFEEQKRREYDERQAAVAAEFEARLKRQTDELNEKMESYRKSLTDAQVEQEKLQAGLQDELARARRETAQARELAAARQSEARSELESLSRRQEEIRLVENRIVTLYDEVNARLGRGEYDAALERLDRLEEFIESPGAARIPSVAERRGVERFLIGSLRRLIRSETAAKAAPADGGAEAVRTLLASVTARVEEGNLHFQRGDREAARSAYTAALGLIPPVEESYARLRDIENGETARERRMVEEKLAEADGLYRNSRYEASVERYREALRLLENRAAGVAGIVPRLLDAGYALRRAEEPPSPPAQTITPPPEAIVRTVPGELSEADRALLERARTAEDRRRLLVGELDRLKARYTAAGASGGDPARDALVALLNAKLLIRQALSADEIREAHPDIYKTVDSVFEAYGEERRIAGREEAFADIAALTGYLARRDAVETPLPDTAEESRRRELLAAFLDNLKKLLEAESAP